MRWRGEQGPHQEKVHDSALPLPGLCLVMYRKAQDPLRAQEPPGMKRRKGTLAQVGSPEPQGQSHVQAIVHQE